MKRTAMNILLEWKESASRKPLVLRGVRQVGKTWLMKEFGTSCFEELVYVNLDLEENYRSFFETTKQPSRIVEFLRIATGKRIEPGKSLIVFDEAQECPKAINSLKYFCEELPEQHIICAGSLLGVALAGPESFPVGKVEFLDILPMTFTEFLLADGCENLAGYLSTLSSLEPIPNYFTDLLTEKLKIYIITGGMPEVVKVWTRDHDIARADKVLRDIIEAYDRDFSKHPSTSQWPKIRMIWQSIPSQLARENKKFLYSVLKTGARAREYEDALQWLNDTGLTQKIYRCKEPHLPVSAYDDLSAFKIYMADTGVLRSLSNLDPSVYAKKNELFSEFKGALTDNYILQCLSSQFPVACRYWSQTKPAYEVDFIVQRQNQLFPIEVKSGSSVKSRSLQKFQSLFPDEIPLRIRFSLENLTLNDSLLNIPLYLADQTDRLIEIALRQLDSRNEPVQS